MTDSVTTSAARKGAKEAVRGLIATLPPDGTLTAAERQQFLSLLAAVIEWAYGSVEGWNPSMVERLWTS